MVRLLSALDAVAIILAGIAAGTINTVVGSGSLITFPTLLAVGYPPVLANVTNTVGLAPGSFSGSVGYRRELAGQRGRLIWLGAASVSGSVVGAALLLVLPARVFDAVVPALVLLGCVLVVLQPWLVDRLAHRRSQHHHGGPLVWLAVLLIGVYGGYFGAAQGVLLVAVLGLGLDEALQRVNAAKNVLATLVNGVAALFFIVATDVAWAAAVLLALGAIVGGVIGARVGRRLPDRLLRGFIVVIGLVAVWRLL